MSPPAGLSGAARSVRLRRSWPWLVLLLIATLGLAAAISAAFLAHETSDSWSDDLWFEVAKAGVQVVAVGVLGGALAAVWKYLSAWSEGRKEERSKVREELVGLVALYNGVKQVRRILKSQGLDLASHGPDCPVDSGETLTEQQSQAFHEQMLVLTAIQLAFESKARQFGQTDFVGEHTGQVVSCLGDIEHYLNQVLKQAWEERGWTIHAGTDLAAVSGTLQRLFRKDPFRDNMSEPLREITRLINAHVFGEATKETRKALADVVRREAAADDDEQPTGEEKDDAEQ